MNKISTATTSKRPAANGIHERPLNKSRNMEVALSSFSFLFSEIIQYTQKKVTGIPEMERKLGEFGYRIGPMASELLYHRHAPNKREVKALGMLVFLHQTMWKSLFGKCADSLERSTESADEYMIIDNEPVVTRFISVPKDISQLNCAAFMAGMIDAILEHGGFKARVTAHSTPTQAYPLNTTFLIKFD